MRRSGAGGRLPQDSKDSKDSKGSNVQASVDATKKVPRIGRSKTAATNDSNTRAATSDTNTAATLGYRSATAAAAPAAPAFGAADSLKRSSGTLLTDVSATVAKLTNILPGASAASIIARPQGEIARSLKRTASTVPSTTAGLPAKKGRKLLTNSECDSNTEQLRISNAERPRLPRGWCKDVGKLKTYVHPTLSLCISGLLDDGVELVENAVIHLGKFIICDDVIDTDGKLLPVPVSHMVVGQPKNGTGRTLKVLAGVATGCWLLRYLFFLLWCEFYVCLHHPLCDDVNPLFSFKMILTRHMLLQPGLGICQFGSQTMATRRILRTQRTVPCRSDCPP